jgi:hypothetical protein
LSSGKKNLVKPKPVAAGNSLRVVRLLSHR